MERNFNAMQRPGTLGVGETGVKHIPRIPYKFRA